MSLTQRGPTHAHLWLAVAVAVLFCLAVVLVILHFTGVPQIVLPKGDSPKRCILSIICQ